MESSIFEEGRNCSCVKDIDQLGLLVDASEYYDAFFEVAKTAKKSINILGWEVDARVNLDQAKSSLPHNLRDFFNDMAKKNEKLQINIVTWQPSKYLFFGREKFASLKWKLNTPANVNYTPIQPPHMYATYHEKLAIIDNCCAFIGGMDISKKRWDDKNHEFKNPKRKDEEGNYFFPVHDVQFVCSGDLVYNLNEYLNHKSDYNFLKGDLKGQKVCFPKRTSCEVKNIKGAISHTNASRKHYEIENIYFDFIKKAKDYIYIENQYLSHSGIINLLCDRLKEPNGPEVVIVLPYSYRGLFEKAIYINSRNKALKKLKKADRYDRLVMTYPGHEQRSSEFIVVHSKFLAVDNKYLNLGSANLNHRSMRVDGEISLSIESRNEKKTEDFIQNNVARLLSEHLGIMQDEFLREWERNASLKNTVEMLKGRREKTLFDIPYVRNDFKDQFLLLLNPMVDLKYPISKTNFAVSVCFILIMSFMFIGSEL